jgi:hypothetical protein
LASNNSTRAFWSEARRQPKRLGHLQDRIPRVVHADEKRHLDVRPHVVAADQPLAALAVDGDPLDRQIHAIGTVNDGVDHDARARDRHQAVPSGTDQRLFRTHLPVERVQNHRDGDKADHEQHHDNDDKADDPFHR